MKTFIKNRLKKEELNAISIALLISSLIILFLFLTSLKTSIKNEVAEETLFIEELELMQESSSNTNDEPSQKVNNSPIQTEESIASNESIEEVAIPLDSDFQFETNVNTQVDKTNFFSSDGVQENIKGEEANNSRAIIKAPQLDMNAQEEGRIALKLWVDQDGNIVKTQLDEARSTSGSSYLIRLAKKAALSMQYEQSEKKMFEFVGIKIFQFQKH